MDIPISTKRPVWRHLLVPSAVFLVIALGLVYLRIVGTKWRTLKAEDYLLAKAAIGNMITEITAKGELVPRIQVDVTVMIAGTLQGVAVKEGDEVWPGQLLASLESSELEQEIRRSEAAVTTAREDIEDYQNASAGRQRQQEAGIAADRADVEAKTQAVAQIKALYTSGAASRKEVEAAEAVLTAVQQKLAQDQEEQIAFTTETTRQLERFEERLHRAVDDATVIKKRLVYQRITAMCHGTISAVAAIPGKPVVAGEKIFTITDCSSMDVLISVDQNDVSQLEVGQDATVEINDQLIKGRVSYLSPTVEALDTGRDGDNVTGVKVMIEILQSVPTSLRPKMRTDVTIQTSRRKDVVYLPRGPFLASLGSEEFVFVRGSNGRFQKRLVEFGASSLDRIEILKGLRPGETVLISSYEGILEENEVMLGREADK